MRKQIYTLVALSFIVLVSCNKDDEILIDPPTDNPGSQEIPFENVNFSVLEFLPGPGQYVNDPASGYNDVTTEAQAVSYAQERLTENNYVSLGSWGGYIVVKSDKEIIKKKDGYDFAIGCNAFDTSNEPGIVWVMQDANGNGKADDTWYELKGSYYGKEGFEKDYWVTYFKPAPDSPTPWIDSNGETGEVKWLGSYHNQEFYYPLWVKEDSYTLHGSRLPAQAEQNPVTGIWTNKPFEWGYVDNAGEDAEIIEINGKNILINYFKISDAVDQNGNSINLNSIDFIKVQTAINSSSGWLGENSTEVMGFFVTKS